MIDNQLIDKFPLEGEKDTHRIASLLSAEVKPGDVICLNGDLGQNMREGSSIGKRDKSLV